MMRRVSVRGGPATTITNLPGFLRGASWGADDTIVFAASDPETGLWRVPAVGGGSHRPPWTRDVRPGRPHGGGCGCSRTSRGGDTRVLRRVAGEGHPMTPARSRPLKRVLEMHRAVWDRDDTRSSVREAFAKVVACGTEALGAEVFASAVDERVVYHTCKSRACPSCGHQATRAWQRDQWRELPDVPYAHVCLTMPDVLWPMFQRNRYLLHDLPVLGAQVLQQWARQKYGIRLIIVVIPHTFGRHLNFNCHLHILVSEGGLREDGTQWRARARLDRKALMADVALRRHHLAAGSRAGRCP